MCLSVFVVTVSAGGGMNFTDVKKTDWFYDNLETAYEDGLINGRSDKIFDPKANLTYAEAVKLAACMYQRYHHGSVTLTNGSPWYQTYVDYCLEKGIITKNYDWTAYATRAGYMEIFANALPDDMFTVTSSVPDGSIPDVPVSHPYAAAIYKLYRAGIVQGVDEAHHCSPDSNISRAEVAVILCRMMYKPTRITIDLGKDLTISSQPKDCTVERGGIAEFTVSVKDGMAPYSYQWLYSSDNGATWNKYSSGTTNRIAFTVDNFSWLYRCVITDAFGHVAETRFVRAIEEIKVFEFTEQPSDVVASVGDVITLKAPVTGGKAPLTYQWQYRHIPSGKSEYTDWMTPGKWASGRTTAEFSFVMMPDDVTEKYQYRCVVRDNEGDTLVSRTVSIIPKSLRR